MAKKSKPTPDHRGRPPKLGQRLNTVVSFRLPSELHDAIMDEFGCFSEGNRAVLQKWFNARKRRKAKK